MSFFMHCLCICTLICCADLTLANALVLYLEAFRHACLHFMAYFQGEHLDRGSFLVVCFVNKGEKLVSLVP